MRWYVDITPLGSSQSSPERHCVEAGQWQHALRQVRTHKGLDPQLGNVSIDLVEHGTRVIDPVARMRFDIRVAAEDAAITVMAQDNAAVAAEAITANELPTTGKHSSFHPVGLPGQLQHEDTDPATKVQGKGVPATGSVRPAARAPAPTHSPSTRPAAPAPTHSPSTRPAAPAPSHSPSTRPASQAPRPLAQPERAVFALPSIASDAPTARALRSKPPAGPGADYLVVARRSEEPTEKSPLAYREVAYALPEATSREQAESFLRDRLAEAKQELLSRPRGKLVHMAVFDHFFEGKPLRPPILALAWKDWKGEEPEFSTPSLSMPPPSNKPSFPPSQPKMAAPQSAPPGQHVAGGTRPATFPPPRIPTVPPTSSSPSNGPGQAPLLHHTSSFPPPVLPVSHAQPGVEARALTPPPPPGALSQDWSTLSAPRKESGSSPARPIANVPVHRATPTPFGLETITGVFEAMHDLHFLKTTREGADFIMRLCVEKLHSQVGMIHLYDINRQEFVVIEAHGMAPDRVRLLRTSEKDPFIAQIMGANWPYVIDPELDPKVMMGRWSILAAETKSILVCPIMDARRYLGIIELGITDLGRKYRQSDLDGLAYIANTMGEFIAARGIVFDTSGALLT